MGGRSRKSVLRQKLAKYYRERENPLALMSLQETLIRQHRDRYDLLMRNLEYLQAQEAPPAEEGGVSRLTIRKFTSEPDKKFLNRAFYEALYPITMEYRYMPLHAIFVWYLQALEMVYGEKLNKTHLNRLQKWILRWLTAMTPEEEMNLKSEIVTWILNRFT
ncbi:MAG TPA: hypothetical protein ENJ40_08760 [Thermosulfurimonas dismutans]|uniref:Uncharacterized protein n=1 Tax=Thermosulfurimonas dismutans TaxID=999894 RepID=A0A7C3CZD8_9BACT|nr:hypothetical protein [Thermosulfurimonas sp.]HFC98528.1 hypothetical protein [Thermosulfurimonas dismutans]